VGPKFKGIAKAKPVSAAQVKARLTEAVTLHKQGRLEQAKQIYKEILKSNPSHFDALHFLGLIALQEKDYREAADLLTKAIEINPKSAAACYNQGIILFELKQFEAALQSYDKAISLKPDYAEAYSNRGNAFKELLQFEAALCSYDKAISLKPDYAQAYSNRGVVLMKLKRYEAEVESYDKAIALKPDYSEFYFNRGNALKELKQFEAALESYAKAVELDPGYAEAYSNRGNVFKELRQFEAALESFNKAIELKPEYPDLYLNRGAALVQFKRPDIAIDSFFKAISLKPDFANAYNNLGHAYSELRQFEAAINSYEYAFGLEPDINYTLGMLIYTRMRLCDWTDFNKCLALVLDKIQIDAKAIDPFVVQSLALSLPILRKTSESYSKDKHPAAAKPMWSGQRYDHQKIRVAYISCDFKNHPATLNNIGVWERHDRDRFEVMAISYGPVVQQGSTIEGQLKTRLLKAFDKFLDVEDKSDEQIAQLMRDMEIDIAVDISGTMQGSRQGILAHRAAPVQVNLYGYTSGAPYMDYIMADRVTIPAEHEMGYTEKVMCLPDSWLANDTTRQVSARQFTRGELELPESGVVYCSFNNAYKINPQMFDVWMRILQRVPGSVLWLQGGGQEKVKENLSKEASARGVDPTRLVFAHKIESMADHLARHRLADVFLDTLPFNAQTTAVDALWAGLPVLTCLGESSFGRVAGSVLMALGMDELVTKDWQAYEAQAVRIGLESGYAKSLKDKLEHNRRDAPLFDTQRLTHNMESAYEQMHERVQQGLMPQGFEVRVSDGA
jgi:predicted O-linked N-acetylglucosamine transferase (SPINDLY family)